MSIRYFTYALIFFTCFNAIALFLFRKLSKTLYVVFSSLYLIYLFILFYYLRYFNKIMDLNVLKNIYSIMFSMLINKAFISYFYFPVYLLTLLILIILIISSLKYPPNIKAKHLFFPVILLFSFGTAAALTENRFSGRYYDISDQIFKMYGPFAYQLYGFFNPEQTAVEQIKKDIYLDFAPKENSIDKPNIVFIQVESLDASMIKSKRNNRNIMPFLSFLTSEDNTAYFPYCLSYHGVGGTSDSEYSVINSSLPLLKTQSFQLKSFENSMFNHLRNEYSISVYHGNEGKFFNRSIAFPNMGFEYFYDLKKMKLRQSGWGASDGDVFNYILKNELNRTEPSIIYIITMTSHADFTNVRKCQDFIMQSFSNDEYENNFYNSFHYVDQSIKLFFYEYLERHKNTIFIIFGDHASNIKIDNFKSTIVKYSNELLEFVPLIINGKNIKHNSKYEIASFLDIAPISLNLAMFSGRYYTQGDDLLSDNNEVELLYTGKGTAISREELRRVLIQ